MYKNPSLNEQPRLPGPTDDTAGPKRVRSRGFLPVFMTNLLGPLSYKLRQTVAVSDIPKGGEIITDE